MSIRERSQTRVEDALDRLKANYGNFSTVEDEWHLSREEYEWVLERFEAGTIGGAGVWMRNEAGEVLLVREQGQDAWSEPSGKHEPGETLAETARRELREETGVSCRLTGVELAQVVGMETPEKPPLYRLIVVFSGVYESGTIAPAPGEIADAQWWDRHPASLRYDALEELPVPAAE